MERIGRIGGSIKVSSALFNPIWSWYYTLLKLVLGVDVILTEGSPGLNPTIKREKNLKTHARV